MVLPKLIITAPDPGSEEKHREEVEFPVKARENLAGSQRAEGKWRERSL